jgi:hypothetical protein
VDERWVNGEYQNVAQGKLELMEKQQKDVFKIQTAVPLGIPTLLVGQSVLYAHQGRTVGNTEVGVAVAALHVAGAVALLLTSSLAMLPVLLWCLLWLCFLQEAANL